VTGRLIVLNGGSSSGKSGIVRCLQAVLTEPWLAFGVDSFVDSLPAAMQASGAGIDFGPEGEVVVGPVFRQLEAAWMDGIVAMGRAGANIIVDEVFLGGASSQRRWEDALGNVEVLWVAVRCSAAVAAGRELARGDRNVGMAALQAEVVHEGVKYDVEVDTTHTESIDCARAIALHVS
jgi:chloramphenicol 3-O phosphotransferase